MAQTPGVGDIPDAIGFSTCWYRRLTREKDHACGGTGTDNGCALWSAGFLGAADGGASCQYLRRGPGDHRPAGRGIYSLCRLPVYPFHSSVFQNSKVAARAVGIMGWGIAESYPVGLRVEWHYMSVRPCKNLHYKDYRSTRSHPPNTYIIRYRIL